MSSLWSRKHQKRARNSEPGRDPLSTGVDRERDEGRVGRGHRALGGDGREGGGEDLGHPDEDLGHPDEDLGHPDEDLGHPDEDHGYHGGHSDQHGHRRHGGRQPDQDDPQVKDVRVPAQLMRAMAAEAEAAREARAKVISTDLGCNED